MSVAYVLEPKDQLVVRPDEAGRRRLRRELWDPREQQALVIGHPRLSSSEPWAPQFLRRSGPARPTALLTEVQRAQAVMPPPRPHTARFGRAAAVILRAEATAAMPTRERTRGLTGELLPEIASGGPRAAVLDSRTPMPATLRRGHGQCHIGKIERRKRSVLRARLHSCAAVLSGDEAMLATPRPSGKKQQGRQILWRFFVDTPHR